jgi:nitrogen-specific signal transduction histidine kinase/ActR/RegA family two-component response regulator
MSLEDEAAARRVLEERVAHLEKMESIGRLAGGIAHDFNNLLTAILGYTEVLLTNRAADDPDRPPLEEIQKAGLRAASLTQQLLAFSRKQVLLPREVDLNQTVLGLRSMLTRLIREDITLTCEVAAEPAIVTVDPAQVEQVILNLVLNARDALPGGGWIRLDVARLSASDLTPPADAGLADAYVRLRVSDNGVGISPAVRSHLFEPFFTTKDLGKGTGLGLASAHGIVHQSHGWIDVSSEPGEGATFAIHFPAVQLPQTMATEPAAPRNVVEPPRGNETVLLVEDEEAVRRIMSTVLKRQGYTVLEASTPLVALELFERHAEQIALLLTDVVMPVMGGPALAQRLVAIRPALRVLFVSGYTGSVPPQIQSPNVGFLTKPFQTGVLAARVREMLGRPDSSRSV